MRNRLCKNSQDLENLKNTLNELDLTCTQINSIQHFKSKRKIADFKNQQEHYDEIPKSY